MRGKIKLLKLRNAVKNTRFNWEYDSGELLIVLAGKSNQINLLVTVSPEASNDLVASVELYHLNDNSPDCVDNLRGEELRNTIRTFGKQSDIPTRKTNDLIRFLDSVTE